MDGIVNNGSNSAQAVLHETETEHERRVRIFAERMYARLASDLAALLSASARLATATDALEFFSTREEPVKIRAVTDRLFHSISQVTECSDGALAGDRHRRTKTIFHNDHVNAFGPEAAE